MNLLGNQRNLNYSSPSTISRNGIWRRCMNIERYKGLCNRLFGLCYHHHHWWYWQHIDNNSLKEYLHHRNYNPHVRLSRTTIIKSVILRGQTTVFFQPLWVQYRHTPLKSSFEHEIVWSGNGTCFGRRLSWPLMN